ncbi:MAG: Eco47II family restriction endonuclease [Cardiobacteriaceae bacterium]|nr:Eco47II family restriction endonuclease [Cardiobacteriaceae bacterium]
MYSLDFISEENFEQEVLIVLNEYFQHFKSMDLYKFNQNIVDPIKLLFDKYCFNSSFEEIIKQEINRQIDKSNNNSIGYFHQRLFKHIKNCDVPKVGWDIVFRDENKTYFVELKNKHNTMNSSSAAKTYIKMQNFLLTQADNLSVCALVEVIAKKSQNIAWQISVDGEKQAVNERIRRMSIDQFYYLVTGNKSSFANLCRQLPITIEKLINKNSGFVEENQIFAELLNVDKNIITALYKLAFSSYCGFEA